MTGRKKIFYMDVVVKQQEREGQIRNSLKGHLYRVFSKGRNEDSPSKTLDFSWCFGLFLTIQYGRFFILVLLGHKIEKKSWKLSFSKKVRFQGWLKLAQFLLFEFWGLPTLSSISSGISPSIFKIFVLILLQIYWIFLYSPPHLKFVWFWRVLWTGTPSLQ